MSEMPLLFAQAIEAAELAAFEVLCRGTGMVAGRNAFIDGDDFERCDVMAWGLTETYPNDAAHWARHAFPEMPFNGEAVGRFRTRQGVWQWAMRVVATLPLRERYQNVRLFRVERLGPIEPVALGIAGGKQELRCWQATIYCNLVCLTGGRE